MTDKYAHYTTIAKLMLLDEQLGFLVGALHVELDLTPINWSNIIDILNAIQKRVLQKADTL